MALLFQHAQAASHYLHVINTNSSVPVVSSPPCAVLPPPPPQQIRFWGIDSGIRHFVGGSDYRSVRVGAFMGLKIISQVQQRQHQLLINQPSSSVAAVLTEVTSVNRTPSPAASPSPSGGGAGGVVGGSAGGVGPAFVAGGVGRGGVAVAAAGAVNPPVHQHHQQQHQHQHGGVGGGGFFDAVPSHQPQQHQQHGPVSATVAAAADKRRSSGEGAASSSSSRRCMPSSFGSYLANISPSEFKELYEPELPVEVLGSDFLHTYGPHLDTATAVDPGSVYAVRDPTAHPIQENFRWVGSGGGKGRGSAVW